MPVVSYVMLYCKACGEVRKIAPERVYENGALEFPKLRFLACPACQAPMAAMNEYGSPSWPSRGLFPMPASVEWMN